VPQEALLLFLSEVWDMNPANHDEGQRVGLYLNCLAKAGIATPEDIHEGVQYLFSQYADLSTDIPDFHRYLGNAIIELWERGLFRIYDIKWYFEQCDANLDLLGKFISGNPPMPY